MSNASSDRLHSPEKKLVTHSIPWNPWLGVLFVILVFFGSQFVIGMLVSIYPYFKHWTHDETVSWLNDSIVAQFGFILLTEALMIAAIYWFLRRYKTNWSDIGLRKPQFNDVLYGIAGFLPYFVLYIVTVGVVSALVPGLNVDQEQQLGFSDVHGGLQLTMTFISLVVLPPLVEEILVRGFLYSTLKKALPIIGAAIATSLIFAAAHLPEGGAAGPLYIAALDTFVLSLVLIFLREKTGGLWASITLHAIKNGIAFVSLFILHAR